MATETTTETDTTTSTKISNETRNNPCNDCHLDLSKAELPILLVLTLIMNVFAVIILLKIRQKCKGIDHLMVLTLALNDLVTAVLYTIMWIGGWIKCGCMLNRNICSVLGWFASAMVIWSAWVVITMTGCRYLATVKPLYYRSHVTKTAVHVVLVFTLTMTLVQLIFPFFGVAAPYEFYSDNRICAYNFTPGAGGAAHRTILGFLAIEGLLATCVVLYFNFCIVYKLRRKNAVHNQTSNTEVAKTKRTAFANVTKVVSAVYCICYGPFLVRLLYDVIIDAQDQNGVRHSITMTLLFMGPLLNPLVYVICNNRYRDFVSTSLKSAWGKLARKELRRTSSAGTDIFLASTATTIQRI